MLGFLNLVKINNYIKVPKIALATHAYIISRKGAEKLIYYLDGKIHNHIDYCINALASENKIISYVAEKRLIHQTSTITLHSNNVSNYHPLLLNNTLRKIYIDKYVSASYLTTFTLIAFFDYIHVTLLTVFFFTYGTFLALNCNLLSSSTLIFFIISLPDLFHNKIKGAIINFTAMVIPSFIYSFFIS
jgi:hypothetical protein